MKRTKNSHNIRFILLIIFCWITIFFIISTIYYLIFKNTNTSYSFVQKWNGYYSVLDLNLTSHAITDIDGDNQKDILSFSGCVFLSSISKNEIKPEKQCIAPEFSLIVFPDNNKVGQKLTPEKPINYQWLHKSYLVKSVNNKWEYMGCHSGTRGSKNCKWQYTYCWCRYF